MAMTLFDERSMSSHHRSSCHVINEREEAMQETNFTSSSGTPRKRDLTEGRFTSSYRNFQLLSLRNNPTKGKTVSFGGSLPNSYEAPPSQSQCFHCFPSEQQELLRWDAVELESWRRLFGSNGVVKEKSIVIAQ
jgi:hypothetical protein